MPAAHSVATVPAARRSAYPPVAGVPPWGAVVIAATLTLVGLAIEAATGDQELGAPFAACFALGCVLAVIAVRHSAIFTAVVQPPLLLFVAVPTAYYFFHRSEFSSLKGFLITCGYPLIERFPLMLLTSAAVLLVGMARWYFAMSTGAGGARTAGAEAEPPPVRSGPGPLAALAARLTAFTGGNRDDGPPRRREARSRPRHVAARSGRTARPPRPQPAAGARSGRGPRPDHAPRERVYRERRYDYRDHPDYPDHPPPPRRGREPYYGEPAADRRRRTPPPRESYPPRPARAGGSRPFQEAYPPGYRPPPPPGPRSAGHHPVSRVRYRGGDLDRPGYPDAGRPGRAGYPREPRR